MPYKQNKKLLRVLIPTILHLSQLGDSNGDATRLTWESAGKLQNTNGLGAAVICGCGCWWWAWGSYGAPRVPWIHQNAAS